MNSTTKTGLTIATLIFSSLFLATNNAQARDALKVCADPYSLPTSSKEGLGYENKIAELFGEKLGIPVEYTWFPQRIGFIRKTLRNNDTPDESYLCDIVMGVVSNFELAATSKPYYRSTWAMVYVKGRGLDDIKSQDDLFNLPEDRKKDLRIGLFDKSPAAELLYRHDLMDYMRPYQIMSGDATYYPGKILEEDLADDKINLTFIWGPIAGYFAKKIKDHELVVIPLRSEPGLKFDYNISMAVRFGEKEWKEQVNKLIEENRDDINAILTEYGVPLLDIN